MPRIVRSYDELIALPLDEEQAFVLMFVDGSSPEEAIARQARIPVAVVHAIVQELVELGAVDLRRPSEP